MSDIHRSSPIGNSSGFGLGYVIKMVVGLLVGSGLLILFVNLKVNPLMLAVLALIGFAGPFLVMEFIEERKHPRTTITLSPVVLSEDERRTFEEIVSGI